jgi:hypothetical protein
MSDAVLTISSKNYSSWSLRGWLLGRMAASPRSGASALLHIGADIFWET